MTTRYLLLVFCIFLFQCSADSGIVLLENGQSDYSILKPDAEEPDIQPAALVLQNGLEQATGRQLPLAELADGPHTIRLEIDAQNLPVAGIAYRVKDEEIILQGGSAESLLQAVYTFLEREIGIRYLTPEATYTPTQKRITLPVDLDYRYTPEITTRTVHSRLFYEHPRFAGRRKVTTQAFPGYVPEARVHTFHRFMPAEEYFAEHPEYYALRDGVRRTTQLCLTHPDVLEIVKKKVAQLFTENPAYEIISVSQDDNTQYCQCEDCRQVDEAAGSPAGTMIAFVNEVARAFPEKMISTLAYQYTRKAPRGIRPEENVLITLCSIECDRSAPIAEKCPDFAQDLREWGALTDNIRIWDYTTQFTNFLAPFPNLRTLQPNVQLFRDNNARWVFEQHSNNPSELFELRSYLTARLLWNPDLDFDTEMDTFLEGYYGPAGRWIRKYIDRVHDELARDSSFFLFLYGDPSQGFDSFLSAENLELYNTWYDAAEKAVADDPKLLRRVKIARLSVDYASLEAARKNLSSTFSLRNNPDWAADRLEAFAKTCTAANITLMNEMRYSVAEYLYGYRRTLERARQINIAQGKPVTLLTKPKKYANEDPRALTDGALGGASFYANWLGFEGNDCEAVIDLGEVQKVSSVATAFLQVVNHIVFFPKSVSFWGSTDGATYERLAFLPNERPLNPDSKINDIQYFRADGLDTEIRYLKIKAENMGTAPSWHHGSGLPAWIFLDEVQVQ